MKDRDLVRLYWPVELRPVFDALFDIDDAMGDVVARASQPALAAIKLAWWRERLEELDEGKVPAEPRLAAAAELLSRGISGADLARLEAGWAAMLQQTPDYQAAAERGHILFELAASLLGLEPVPVLGKIGELYASAQIIRLGLARNLTFAIPVVGCVAKPCRPLTGLGALAARDLRKENPASEEEGTPGRAWALLRHRLTGRL